jgi:predicted nucleotidyltransferase
VERDRPPYRLDSASRRAVRERLGAALADEPRVAFAFVFGSFAADQPFHDIDVGVFLEPDKGTDRGPDVVDRLERRATAAAGYRVDLVVLNDRPVTFLFHVFRGLLLTARDDEQVTRALERTMRDYFDIAPVLRHATREAFGT